MKSLPWGAVVVSRLTPPGRLKLPHLPRRRKVRELRFRLWGESSVHFLLPEGNPLGGLLLSPPNPIAQPSAALLRYGCGIPLAGTSLGFGGDPIGETLVGVCRKFPLKGGMSALLTRGSPPQGYSNRRRRRHLNLLFFLYSFFFILFFRSHFRFKKFKNYSLLSTVSSV